MLDWAFLHDTKGLATTWFGHRYWLTWRIWSGEDSEKERSAEEKWKIQPQRISCIMAALLAWRGNFKRETEAHFEDKAILKNNLEEYKRAEVEPRKIWGKDVSRTKHCRGGVLMPSYSHDLGMAMLIGTSFDSTYGCGNIGRWLPPSLWGFKVFRID